MKNIPLKSIEINESGHLQVCPDVTKSGDFKFIYRAACGITWNEAKQVLTASEPEKWESTKLLGQIIAAVMSEYGTKLEITPSTAWVNIAQDLRVKLLESANETYAVRPVASPYTRTKKYSDRLKAGKFLLEISFNASNALGTENPEHTNIILECLKSNNKVWERSFGNIPVPSSPWLGFTLLATYKNRFFAAVSNSLMEVNIENGEIKWQTQTGNTPIHNILVAKNSKQLIVRNGDYKFKHPAGKSNIAAYSFDGAENWRCKLEDNDIFANRPYFRRRILHKTQLRAGSWRSFDCHIDENTGAILSREFTK